ncbi:hypothetical protein [Streptomyces sp. 1-11]|uniref:hypothetical protein n=1 Tax=Streptomyces sp. 1-11 TaxID=2590549 RepID=UPI001358E9BE|nr:hypothetical protein [Streptomyces sp. 1-11]
MTCDDPSKAGDPALSVVAWVGFAMTFIGVASIIGAVAWYIVLVLVKREVDAGRR